MAESILSVRHLWSDRLLERSQQPILSIAYGENGRNGYIR